MISPAAILGERVPVTLADGRSVSRPATVFGPLAVALARDGDVTEWMVIHLASGREITEARSDNGLHAMAHVGALLALPIDWYLITPPAGWRLQAAAALAAVQAGLR